MGIVNEIKYSLIRKIVIRDKSINSKFPLVVNNDHIGKSIIIDGYYEKFYLENLVKILPQKVFRDTMLDIGSNIGNHSVFLSSYFNKIILFEPQIRTFKINELNTDHIDNIESYNFGLSNKDEVLEFTIHKQNFGNGKLKDLNFGNKSDYFNEQIFVKKYDNLKIKDKISFVKIDVEGFESQALQGMKKTLSSDKPILAFEYNDSEAKKTELKETLIELGYIDFFVFKRENKKALFSKLSQKDNNKLVRTTLDVKQDYSMVLTYHSDNKYLFD